MFDNNVNPFVEDDIGISSTSLWGGLHMSVPLTSHKNTKQTRFLKGDSETEESIVYKRKKYDIKKSLSKFEI